MDPTWMRLGLTLTASGHRRLGVVEAAKPPHRIDDRNPIVRQNDTRNSPPRGQGTTDQLTCRSVRGVRSPAR